MAKSGFFANLHYTLHVRALLCRASRANPTIQAMARTVPAGVYHHWRDTAHIEFPGIRVTPGHFALSCSALLQFFHLVAIENAPMMLPSKAADSVWHAWLAHNPQGLSAFLTTHLERDVPHVEKGAMGSEGKTQRTMADTWRAAHDYHGNVQFAGRLPSIFEADKLTGIPHGFWYDRNPQDRREGHYYDMDAKGAPHLVPRGGNVLSWPRIHGAMTPARRAQADAQILRHYNEPSSANAAHAQMLARLGIPVVTTAAVFLANEAVEMAARERGHRAHPR